MDSTLIAEVFALLAALAFSMGGLMSRYGLRTSTPLTNTLILGVVTLGIYGPIAWATMPASGYKLAGLLIFFAGGVASPGMARTMQGMSIRRIGLARSVTISNSAPLVTIVIAVAALGERPTAWVYLGTFLLVGGVILLTREPQVGAPSTSRQRSVWYYFIYALLSSLMLGIATSLRKVGIGIVPSLSAGLAATALGTLVTLFLWYPFFPPEDRFQFSREGFTYFFVSSLFTSTAHLAFFAALQRAPLATVAPLASVVPLFTLFLSWLLLRQVERLNPRLTVGVVLICAGAALITVFRG